LKFKKSGPIKKWGKNKKTGKLEKQKIKSSLVIQKKGS